MMMMRVWVELLQRRSYIQHITWCYVL